jgi:tetratricopeptide (TPR) repeat protein
MPEVNSTQPPPAGPAVLPDLDAVLDGTEGLDRLGLITLLRADQQRRWQAGQRVPAEDYILAVAALRDDLELAIDLIFSEFLLRRDVLREGPTLDEYLARFPEHATVLRHQLELDALAPEAARTQGRDDRAPATAAAPAGASEWTVLGSGSGAAAAPVGTPALPGYEVLGELGRGGMGLVLRRRDLHLGRDLAVKLLHEEYQGQPHLIRRFINEARICGRLQHPGIVPVHELGALADGRPYFTMKLVEGRTLADLLKERGDPAQDRPRLLAVFEQVCQAVAYARSKGVIHRDLKPGNVMVGAFGEVQVMDWGLAKALARDAAGPPAEGAVGGGPGGGDRWLGTQLGHALGTLPYMPPEQARGEVGRMDERCDVFSLGAILCEVLTGWPPFAGRDGAEVLARAQACDHTEALAALDRCGADGELVRLARGCLAAEPSARPRDAGAVARAVTAYLAGVQERLRAAEIERAAAQARAEEARATVAAERRSRRRAAWLAAAVLALVTVGAAGSLLVWYQAAERREGVESALKEAVALREQARWPEAQAVLDQARRMLRGAGPADLRQRLDVAEAELALVNRLDAIRQRRAAVPDGQSDFRAAAREYAAVFRAAAHEYAAAFREAGLGEVGDDQEAVAARVRDSGVAARLVGALDDWAAVTREPQSEAWLLRVACRADPDPWRNRFRDPAVRQDRRELRALAKEVLRDEGVLAQLSPQMLELLGARLPDDVDSVPLLRAAQRRHPSDFWLSLALGNALREAKQVEEALGYFRVAVALRPDASAAHNNLGNVLRAKKDLDGALAEFRAAIALDPNDALAHYNLGITLRDKGDLEGAIAESRRAIASAPADAIAHNGLGTALYDKQDLEGAIAEYLTAIDLDPKHAYAHVNLGNALRVKKDLDGAVAEYKKAIESDANNALAHYNFGIALYDKKDLDGALAEWRTALDLDPTNASAHLNLGAALAGKQDLEGATAAYRRALEIDPKNAKAHNNLGGALLAKQDVTGAIAELRQAIALDPKYASARYNLSQALLQQERFAEAGTETWRCLDLLPENDPRRPSVARQLQQCARLAALDEKLSAVLSGAVEPTDAAERLALAQLCG